MLGGGAPPAPTTRESMEERWKRYVADPDSINFVIEADGLVIGQCGLFNPERVARTMELGITVGDKDYWGRGYGREAVQLVVDYAFTYCNVRKVHLGVLSNNPRAIAAYTKAGFVEEGRQREQAWSAGEYVDLILMGIIRAQA